ncbi:unnamed protein product [Urochloa decumbens]|uniref:Protein kinase domain-containing protein n=1 Tax=Urochloa decumbens TaxID=240449 RepID=A0ABC9ASX9_9POAL
MRPGMGRPSENERGLKESETMAEHTIGGPLEDLEKALQRAHTMVRTCQGRNIGCLLFTAGKLSRRLRRLQDDISQKMMLVMFAIHVDKFVETSRPHPPPRPSHGSEIIGTSRPRSTPRPSHDSGYHDVAGNELERRHTRVRPSDEDARAWYVRESDVDTKASEFIQRFFKDNNNLSQGSKPPSAPIAGSAPPLAESNAPPPLAGTKAPPSPLLPGLTKFSLSELEVATNNFSEENKTGSSDVGTVYKGVLMLHDKIVVAVKKFPDPPLSFVSRVYNELGLVSVLQREKMEELKETAVHDQVLIPDMCKADNSRCKTNKNLIRIHGYCHEVKDKAVKTHIFLVEEYMPNGDMGNIIYGSQFDCTSRFRIILGVAHGIHYLHEQHVLHLDLKPANILLDSDMNPKITNFWTAKTLNEMITLTDNIEGTVRYMPPEYVFEGILSVKYDVYSFGIIVLETISGMCRSGQIHLQAPVEWGWEAREDQQMTKLFSPSLCDESHLAQTVRCMEIGLLCTQEKMTDRPTMADVLEMLNGNKELPTPHRPCYTKRKAKAPKEAHHDTLYNCF